MFCSSLKPTTKVWNDWILTPGSVYSKCFGVIDYIDQSMADQIMKARVAVIIVEPFVEAQRRGISDLIRLLFQHNLDV